MHHIYDLYYISLTKKTSDGKEAIGVAVSRERKKRREWKGRGGMVSEEGLAGRWCSKKNRGHDRLGWRMRDGDGGGGR